jgi:ATPase family associated with various cellular activities (AAA)
MTTVFLRNGSIYTPTSEADLDMFEKLPGGNYIIVKHPMTGALMFQQVDSFRSPPKLYGNIQQRADRILRTYRSRPNSTGVLLAGEKGSGKTQLARLLAENAAVQGTPCIIINAPWVGDEFFKLLQSVEQECIVLFDEFEKVYDHDEQKQVLTLLDGVFPSKKLFVLTCNDKWLINDHMRNRPGRIFYMLEYKGLPQDFIIEYCKDTLGNQVHIKSICKIAQMFYEFNFDMLKAMVEEMNRYDESPEQVLEMLNARPTTDNQGSYNVTLIVDGATATRGSFYPSEFDGSPMHEQEISITYTSSDGEPSAEIDEDDLDQALASLSSPTAVRRVTRPGTRKRRERETYTLRQEHLKKFDAERGVFEYQLPDDNIVVKFTRVRHKEAQFMSLLA